MTPDEAITTYINGNTAEFKTYLTSCSRKELIELTSLWIDNNYMIYNLLQKVEEEYICPNKTHGLHCTTVCDIKGGKVLL